VGGGGELDECRVSVGVCPHAAAISATAASKVIKIIFVFIKRYLPGC
jgi:hypothetical protein